MISLRDPAAGFSDLVESGEPCSIRVPKQSGRAAEFLKEQGLVVRVHRRSHLQCALCGSMHAIDERTPDGAKYVCTRAVGTTTSPEPNLWRADWGKLQALLIKEMGCNGSHRSLVPGNLALLGKLGNRTSSFPVWLARGMLLAERRSAILDALETRSGRHPGVVISASRPDPLLAFPHGSRVIWLGDILDLSTMPPGVDTGQIYRTAPVASVRPRSRGRPPARFDALTVFLDRIRTGRAIRNLTQEAKALQTIEAGVELDTRPTRIEAHVRSAFRAWEATGFDPNFRRD